MSSANVLEFNDGTLPVGLTRLKVRFNHKQASQYLHTNIDHHICIRMLFIQNVTIVKPIVYGNIAKYFGKKREEDNHTHEWTFYLKPFDNEVISNSTFFYNRLIVKYLIAITFKDSSSYIQRVHIKLHDSYTNANRGKQS